jgi:hypothetical protein
LVSTDVSQPIQKIIGIGYLMSADTINHIFGIGCTMSADTNNVLDTINPNRGEILVCAVRLPKFPTLDAAPSTPPSSMLRHRTNPVVDPTFGLDVTGSAPVVIPDHHRHP